MTQTISKGVVDEVFVVRDHSLLIDIARLIDAINNEELPYHMLEIETETLLKFARADMYCKQTILNMTDRRRDEPVLVTRFSERSRVIDGNHRFLKRLADKFAKCQVIAIEPQVLINFTEPFP